MARIFKTPFGAQGDTEQVPEAPQGDGSVSLTQGFGYDYEREYEDPAAKDIRREVMNGLFHDITEAVGDIQLSGIAKWSADAAPYPAGAVVWHSSVAWLSRVNNNSTTPSEGASWSAVATADSVGNAYVPLTRTITAGTGLSGGGSLDANRTLSVDFATPEQAQALTTDDVAITPETLGAAMNSHVLGMGQTWQDVTASRALSTNYTNTTGRTIYIAVSVQRSDSGGLGARGSIDGTPISSSRMNSPGSINAVVSVAIPVPAGATYSVDNITSGQGDLQTWSELR